MWVALAGARAREKRQWQHTLAIAQAVYNWGGPRPKNFDAKPLGTMYERAFPKEGTTHTMSLERYRRIMAEHDEGMRHRYG